jgi:GTP-binding protein
MRHWRPGTAARHRARASKERSLTDPCFVGSFPRADVALALPLPEVAFLGRSNVGKSSLLNAFAGQRIARISATPGKTRALNVFQIRLEKGAEGRGKGAAAYISPSPSPPPPSLYLLDLPGYGYARASKGERTAFRGLLHYVVQRTRLAGVVWLLDIRRDPSPDDQAMQDTFAAAGTRVLAALTKSDKLPRGQRLARAAALREALAVAADQLIVTSARTGEGVPELRQAVVGLIA